ncbi:MAG: RIP metalloprotease RseP [Gammaproteobacteria bacterium]|nr:MAG: RIP metalloprotease RseP [Gammaproteobacteria bacterium]
MLSHFAFTAIAFVVALGILITIHEFGHFWVARRMGVRVLRFSIGFGPALWRRVGKDGTEYVLAAIPLGGYVKMLDEREAPVDEADLGDAFNRKPLSARAAIVAAGPMANFLLAIAAYWLVGLIGTTGIAPLVGEPQPGTPAAAAGFVNEDRITSVNGKAVATWTDARIAILDAAMQNDAGSMRIGVETAQGAVVERHLDIDPALVLKVRGDPLAGIGFDAWRPHQPPVFGEVLDDGAAARAGIVEGDRVMAIDGEPIGSFGEVVERVVPAAGQTLAMTLERDGQEIIVDVTPEAVTVNGESRGRIGVIETHSAAAWEKARVTVRYGVLDSLGQAVVRTWEMTALTVRMLAKLVTGQAAIENLSGPLTIAQVAGQTAAVGIDHYIGFIALISISLAVLNLLPIPILDGGHLVYFALEAITGRPPSERVQMIGQQLGMLLLGALMMLAFYNDIGRLLQ